MMLKDPERLYSREPTLYFHRHLVSVAQLSHIKVNNPFAFLHFWVCYLVPVAFGCFHLDGYAVKIEKIKIDGKPSFAVPKRGFRLRAMSSRKFCYISFSFQKFYS